MEQVDGTIPILLLGENEIVAVAHGFGGHLTNTWVFVNTKVLLEIVSWTLLLEMNNNNWSKLYVRGGEIHKQHREDLRRTRTTSTIRMLRFASKIPGPTLSCIV